MSATLEKHLKALGVTPWQAIAEPAAATSVKMVMRQPIIKTALGLEQVEYNCNCSLLPRPAGVEGVMAATDQRARNFHQSQVGSSMRVMEAVWRRMETTALPIRSTASEGEVEGAVFSTRVTPKTPTTRPEAMAVSGGGMSATAGGTGGAGGLPLCRVITWL